MADKKKKTNGVDLTEEYIPMRKQDIQAIDYLIKISKGKEKVRSDKDWVILSKVFEWWTRRWPEEWQDFAETIELIKETRLNKSGMSGSGEIKYVGALPPRFERILKTIFPLQEFDKKFVNKLAKKIKITQVGDKKDTWFVI